MFPLERERTRSSFDRPNRGEKMGVLLAGEIVVLRFRLNFGTVSYRLWNGEVESKHSFMRQEVGSVLHSGNR
jgi:hypothetical protein